MLLTAFQYDGGAWSNSDELNDDLVNLVLDGGGLGKVYEVYMYHISMLLLLRIF